MFLTWRKKNSLTNDRAKVLVLTLHSGENEFDSCLSALDSQSFQNFNHVVISDLGKKEAHDLLYKTIMENSEYYDYFFKLDADMVLMKNESLSKLLMYIGIDDIDKLTVTVFDFFTNSAIIGAHIFSKRVTWRISDEKLFTDTIQATYPGKAIIIRETDQYNISHAADPSEFQSFIFGVHRAMKAIQIGRSDLRLTQCVFQFSVLMKVYRAYLKSKDKRHLFALAGAKLIFNDRVEENSFLTNKKEYEKKFKCMDVD